MAIDLLNNCHFDAQKISKLYLGSTLYAGGNISFPIAYNIIDGSSNSLVGYQDLTSTTITLGGQEIILNEILSIDGNITFQEELVIDNRGRNYVKTITFNLPGINQTLVDEVELYSFDERSKNIALLVDENEQTLLVGYDFPLSLDSINTNMGEDNLMTFIFKSSSSSRARDIAKLPPSPSASLTPTPTPSITPSCTPTPSITPSCTPTPSITPSITPTPSTTPPPMTGFTTEWTVSGDATGRTIYLPYQPDPTYTIQQINRYTYDFTVYWGDGNSDHITTYNGLRTHTYTDAGTYRVEIKGQCPTWYMGPAATFPSANRNKITDIITWGDSGCFDGFSDLNDAFYGANIKSLGIGKIIPHTTIDQGEFFRTFYGCISITGITSGLFDNCTEFNSLQSTFGGCSGLTSIPSGLFDTLTGFSNFNSTFISCSALTTIPSGLFDENINAQIFVDTFNYCSALTTIPNGLFKYTTNAADFTYTFANCPKLQINPWTFYITSGETSTRFLNKSVDFSNCFYRTSFSGTQGTAPDLWNCDFGTGTVTKTSCFYGAGNSLTSISNYGDIPNDWIT